MWFAMSGEALVVTVTITALVFFIAGFITAAYVDDRLRKEAEAKKLGFGLERTK